MARGMNRADPIERLSRVLKAIESSGARGRPCIFISHIRQDTESCILLVEYVLNAGVDVYFDKYDQTLDELVREGNPDKVTRRIQDGIEQSTHMLCVVSPATIGSYWVPFEVGYGYGKIPLGVLTLRGLADQELPDYLRTTKVIRGTLSLNNFIAELLGATREALEGRSILRKHTEMQHALDRVLDWAK